LDQYKGALSTAIAECGLRISECQKQNNSAFRIPYSAIEGLLKTAEFGIALSHPLKVTIAGSPNAGKSTLINALLGKERVIVHHEPGTTRDAVTDIISVDGIPLELTDTAGIRNTNDAIEGLAINESLRRLLAADIAVIVFDNSRPQNEDDLMIIKSLGIPPIPPFSKGGKGGFEAESPPSLGRVETIPVVNKIDLFSALNISELQPHFSVPICQISALNGTGIPELKKRLVARFADYIKYVPGRAVVFTERQKGLLLEAATALRLWHEEKSLPVPLARQTGKSALERVIRAFNSLRLAHHHDGTVANDDVMLREHRRSPLSGRKLSLPYYRANL
ncbi:MAG: GTP-binding protein, partial [Planctomycetes bacterium]|nr:GTP-binding protein [Planctomycetota bacterium]